jgi:hypothetical protein
MKHFLKINTCLSIMQSFFSCVPNFGWILNADLTNFKSCILHKHHMYFKEEGRRERKAGRRDWKGRRGEKRGGDERE